MLINPKAVTTTTQTRVMPNQPIKEMRWNHKTYSITINKDRKREEKGERTDGANGKQ